MNKIVVTGSYGQLGSEIKKLSTLHPGFSFVFTDYDTLDITDRKALECFFSGQTPDYVINCAAYTAVDQAEKEPEKAKLLNAAAPGYLAELCEKHNAKLIHISTDYVFNGESFIPVCEDVNPDPQGVYGKTKLDGEVNITKANPHALIIRTSWLYSSFGNNFVKTIMRICSQNDKIRVVFDQVGTPTYAHDLAGAILSIIEQTSVNKSVWKPGIYHYSNEGVCSWYDFAMEIKQMAGILCQIEPIESKDFPTLAKRPSYSVLNKSKIKSAFGLDIPYWKESLELCIKSILNN